MLLLRTRQAFQWGVVVIADAETNDLPDLADNRDGFGIGTSAIVCTIQQETDGPAEVEVHIADHRDTADVLLSAEIQCPSGVLEVSDAGQQFLFRLAVGPKAHVAVYGYDGRPPAKLVIVVVGA